MSIIARRAVIIGSSVGLILPKAVFAARSVHKKSIGQKWIDGWNATTPDALVAAFTPDGVYEDVAFGLRRKEALSCVNFTSPSTILSASCTSS
jgi:hypothetical protein